MTRRLMLGLAALVIILGGGYSAADRLFWVNSGRYLGAMSLDGTKIQSICPLDRQWAELKESATPGAVDFRCTDGGIAMWPFYTPEHPKSFSRSGAVATPHEVSA